MTARRLVGLVAFTVLGLILADPRTPAQDGKKGTISGKVTLDGQPVAKGRINFHPEKGRGAASAPIRDGTYATKGGLVGKFKVTVEADRVPKQYTDPKTTPL